MMLRNLCLSLILVAGIFTPGLCGAQEASDLIWLAANDIAASNKSIFIGEAGTWLDRDGADQISRLRQLGPIKRVDGTTDSVVGQTWTATGRAIHEGGASDWLLVFSNVTRKIVRLRIEVTFVPDELPPLPHIAFRGLVPETTNRSPSSLKPCVGVPDLCLTKDDAQTDPRVVEFLFAATRQKIGTPNHVTFSGERGPEMVLGGARVRVPEQHRFGKIELPHSGLLNIFYEVKADPSKHFVIQDVKILTEGDWDRIISEKNTDEALIFVHGFNTGFDDSLYRMAQIVWDLQYSGVPVLFTWPSRGTLVDYVYDRESALIARSSFISLLNMLEAEHGIKRIHVLAHSMGNFLVMEALRDQANAAAPAKLSELMMAAPDVDRDYYTLNAPQIRKVVAGMTLYASSADKALAASRTLAGGISRAGDVPAGGPIVLPQIDSIDVTAVGNDILGLNHDTFAVTRSVMDDIGMLLTENPRRVPNRRLIEIRGVPEGGNPPRYYRLTP
jgi:esterase/lipase superfamily enzyme